MSTTRRNIVIFSIAAIVGIVALYLFALQPFETKIKEKSENIYQERIQAAVTEVEQQNVQITKAEYERLQSQSKTLDQFFVREDDILAFISSLETIAQQASVTQDIQNLRAPEGTSRESHIQLVLSGNFSALMRYLADLESSPYYVAIDKLTFSSPGTGTGTQLTLQATIFWL